MESEIIQFTEFINNKKTEINLDIQELIAADKKDESNFKKAKLNIYDVYQTMFQIAIKNDSKDKVEEFFLQKINSIPMSWKVSLEKAKEFGDMEKILIEEEKLEAVNELYVEFIKIWRG